MQKMEIELFEKFKFISQMKANPSGNNLVFLSAKADLEKNSYFYDLYSIENYKMAKLIKLKETSQILWENDESIIYPFTNNKAEEKLKKEFHTIYYRYNLTTKKVSKAYQFNFPLSIIDVLGTKLLIQSSISLNDEALMNDGEKARSEYLKKRKENLLYENIDQVPFYFNGQGFINGKTSRLFIYDKLNQTMEQVTPTKLKVQQSLVSPCKKYIYYTAQPTSDLRVLYTNIFRYNLETKATETVFDKTTFSISYIEFLNDKLIAAANDNKSYGINQNDHFYEVKQNDLHLFASYGLTMFNTVGSDVKLGSQKQVLRDKNRILFIATVEEHCEIQALNIDGSIEVVFKANGSIDGLTMVEEKIYFVGQLKQRLQEIYAFNHGKDQQLTRLNYRTIKDYYVAKPKKYVLKKSTHEVAGFALMPFEFDANKKYPMILDIHGGPKTVYGSTYYHEMQYWASQGYVVVYCNPRGSDGKGDEFADIRGIYGSIDYDDIMEFTDLVMKKIPQIDETRQYVTGGSYGGFMTNWIVSHTNRFKAAVTQRSISNWLSFFGTSDIGFYFAKDQTAGDPLNNAELMWDQSPLKYANNVETPLLFIHSDEDYRCPIEQAMQFYTVLKYKGVETKLIWFKGETHELSRGGKPQARIKRLKDISNWFFTH